MDEATRRVRDALRAETPPSYRWYKHIALVAVFVAFGLSVAVAALDGLRLFDAVSVIAILLFLNFGEYAAHRWTMHRKVFPRIVHHRHVVEHHRFFTFDSMAVDSWDDLRWVLFPWWALPLLVVSVLPFFLLIAHYSEWRTAWIFLLAVMLYYGIYEIFHTMAHLPEGGRFSGSRWVRRVTHHHRVHHDLALMRDYNFNFAIPLYDWLFGTIR